jgi:hypothetical protein
MIDSDYVLLLRPLNPQRGITVLPAVDPVIEETGARGIVVAKSLKSRQTVSKRSLGGPKRHSSGIGKRALARPLCWSPWISLITFRSFRFEPMAHMLISVALR